jgi:hypothetical protein
MISYPTTKEGTLAPYRGETAVTTGNLDLNSHHLTFFSNLKPASPSHGRTLAVTSLGVELRLRVGLGRRRRDGHGRPCQSRQWVTSVTKVQVYLEVQVQRSAESF